MRRRTRKALLAGGAVVSAIMVVFAGAAVLRTQVRVTTDAVQDLGVAFGAGCVGIAALVWAWRGNGRRA